MTTPTTGTIYALVDPRTNGVRYVGQTTKPLAVRLAGHLTNPAPRVGIWIDELHAHNLEPDIAPLQERVPVASLAAIEKAEITRRLLDGDELLNEQGTSEARAVLWERRAAAEAERDRADWMRIAEIAREALGGLLPPGDLPPVAVLDRLLSAHRAAIDFASVPEVPREPGDDNWLSKETQLRQMRGRAQDAVWSGVRGAWGHLRGKTKESFDFRLEAAVSAVGGQPWADDDTMTRYITLVPWALVVVAPWAAMAARAGMKINDAEFIEWVTEDSSTREALRLLLVEAGDSVGAFDVLDRMDREVRPSMLLAVMTAAYCGVDLPESMNAEARRLLISFARDRQLTEPMARVLQRLDPKATDAAYGPNVAAEIDARLGLASGTSRQVFAALLETPHVGYFGKLEDVVTRADRGFPTVDAPDYHTWTWDIGPAVQAVVASFARAGLVPPPESMTRDEFIDDANALWRVWTRWQER